MHDGAITGMLDSTCGYAALTRARGHSDGELRDDASALTRPEPRPRLRPPTTLADLRAYPPISTALPTQASESAAVTRKSATSAREIEPGTGAISARVT